jgi:hypothetical protein
MESHEGNGMKRHLLGRARFVTAATAVVSAVALAVPGMAGAASSNRSPTTSYTITQNTSMIVDVSGTSSTTSTGTVSWSDVSWSDQSLVN